MNRTFTTPLLFAAVAVLGLTACPDSDYRKTFDIDPSNWTATGRNAYLILEPGYRLVLKGGDGGDTETLTITVLDETKIVDGVETRIVEEREKAGGELKEISRNYFALDKSTGDIYYFGEEVDAYRDGTISGHGGSWISGVHNAKFGLFVPGKPEAGMKYYQELAPKTAMDRAEVIGVQETLWTPAGTFNNCLKTLESSGLEPGQGEYKFYAPGIGLIFDAGLKLVSFGKK